MIAKKKEEEEKKNNVGIAYTLYAVHTPHTHVYSYSYSVAALHSPFVCVNWPTHRPDRIFSSVVCVHK